MTCFVILGKYGDQLSVLPVIHNEYIQTGERPHVLVAPAYRHIAERLDWCVPVLFEGDWDDLRGAITFAKSRYSRVVVPQVHGRGMTFQHRTPSFQLDQWQRCGALGLWGKLPLRLDGEEKLDDPFILYADHGQSSPFQHKEELGLLLEQFKSHKIVRLSAIRKDSPLDLVGLMNRSACLVTVDTMHLHLGRLTNAPIIALAADSPSRWSGSAAHPHDLLHCRYSDFQTRKQEFVWAVERAVNNRQKPAIEIVPTAHAHAYNMSAVEHGNKCWTTYRHHPDPKSWRTVIAISDGSHTWDVVPPAQYEKHSVEDARLFVFNGKLCMSVTVGRSNKEKPGFFNCIIGWGELEAGDAWKFKTWHEPRYGKNDWTGTEKNWCPMVVGSRLYFIYKCVPEQVVIEVDGARIVREYKTPVPACAYGEPRGGTPPVAHGDHWLRFFHANTRNPKSDIWWTYHMGAMAMESRPPFRILKISNPLLTGDEQYVHGCNRWKPRVVFPLGAVAADNGWRVAAGLNDCQCAWVRIKESDLALT